MRRLKVNLHRFKDVAAFSSAFKAALDDFLRRFPADFSVTWTEGDQLNQNSAPISVGGLLNALAQVTGSADPPEWRAHVLVARKHQESKTDERIYGQMFDDVAPFREGCSVFLEDMEAYCSHHTQPELLPILFARTVVHELGHVLNLVHEDHAFQPHAIMLSNPPFSPPNLHRSRFSSLSRAHLSTHDDDTLRPGSHKKFTDRDCRDAHGFQFGDSGTMSTSSSARLELGLLVHPGVVYRKTSRPTFVIGEPVSVTLRVTNRGHEPVFLLPHGSSARGDWLLERIEADRRTVLSAPETQCGSYASGFYQPLKQGETRTFSETLFSRAGDVVFPREGVYRLKARFSLAKKSFETHSVTCSVAPPLRPRHEETLELATVHDLSLFFELNGDPALTKGKRLLRRLLKMNSRFPLIDHGLCALFLKHGLETAQKHFPELEMAQHLARLQRGRKLPQFIRKKIRKIALPSGGIK